MCCTSVQGGGRGGGGALHGLPEPAGSCNWTMGARLEGQLDYGSTPGGATGPRESVGACTWAAGALWELQLGYGSAPGTAIGLHAGFGSAPRIVRMPQSRPELGADLQSDHRIRGAQAPRCRGQTAGPLSHTCPDSLRCFSHCLGSACTWLSPSAGPLPASSVPGSSVAQAKAGEGRPLAVSVQLATSPLWWLPGSKLRSAPELLRQGGTAERLPYSLTVVPEPAKHTGTVERPRSEKTRGVSQCACVCEHMKGYVCK